MPIIKSAIKRAKQTTKRRLRNVAIKQDIKSATKAFMIKPSAKTLSAAQGEIDTAVKKGLIKKNAAARRKSNLHAIAKSAGVKMTAAAKKPTVTKPATKSLTTKTIAKKSAAKKPAAKPVTTKKASAKKPATKKAAK